MRFDHLIAAALATIVICPASVADTKEKSDGGGDANTCRSFVQSFYKWYLSKPQSDRAFKDKASAFSPELLKERKEDYAASQKVSGEVVGLDFDPFLNTNAAPHAKYVATKVTKKNNNYLVQVDGSGATERIACASCRKSRTRMANASTSTSTIPVSNHQTTTF